MALFKFRKGGDEPVAAAGPAESIEALRRRARHRLIGAALLVLAGVVGFPLVFDTQPRPIPVDIAIEIPDRNKTKPLAVPAPLPSHAPSAVATGPVTPASPPAVATPPKTESQMASIEPPKAEAPVPKLEAPKAEAKPEPRPEVKPAAPTRTEPARTAASSRPADGARAQALLEGKPVLISPAAEGRFIVQVGAFADESKARDTRQKVERAGLKTYTHVAETKDGKRTRVRVGPFATRADAEKAAQKIKGLDLPAAILTL